MLLNYWYCACASSRLRHGKPLSVRLFDFSLALFRTSNGQLSALRDRCPHRGLPLSVGRVKENGIQCGFHGWEFGTDGVCRMVPSLGKGTVPPDVFRVDAFPCRESDGYVWVYLGGGVPDVNSIPKVHGFATRSWLQGSLSLACNFVKAVEINVDSSHVYFVHPKHPATLAKAAQPDRPPTTGEVRTSQSGLVTFWPATAQPNDPVPVNAETITFTLPNRVTISGPGGLHGFVVDLFFVPTGDRQCQMEYLVSQPQVPGHSVKWLDTTPDVFAEDKAILEAIEKSTAGSSNFVEKNVPADTAPLLARKMIDALKDATFDQVFRELPQRVLFTI